MRLPPIVSTVVLVLGAVVSALVALPWLVGHAALARLKSAPPAPVKPKLPAAVAAAPVALPESAPYQVGIASWYGSQFQGRETSSGVPFNMFGLTAAHRTLPLGTRVRVTNLLNDRSVLLTINDRGPVVPGRIIDLSYAAARVLRCRVAGLVPVRIDLAPAVRVFLTQNLMPVLAPR